MLAFASLKAKIIATNLGHGHEVTSKLLQHSCLFSTLLSLSIETLGFKAMGTFDILMVIVFDSYFWLYIQNNPKSKTILELKFMSPAEKEILSSHAIRSETLVFKLRCKQ